MFFFVSDHAREFQKSRVASEMPFPGHATDLKVIQGGLDLWSVVHRLGGDETSNKYTVK